MTGMPRPLNDRAAIEAEIDRVRSLDVDSLRTLWRTTFRSSPPPAFSKDIPGAVPCPVALAFRQERWGAESALPMGAREETCDSVNHGLNPGPSARELRPFSSRRMWSVSGKLVLPVDVVVASRLELGRATIPPWQHR